MKNVGHGSLRQGQDHAVVVEGVNVEGQVVVVVHAFLDLSPPSLLVLWVAE